MGELIPCLHATHTALLGGTREAEKTSGGTPGKRTSLALHACMHEPGPCIETKHLNLDEKSPRIPFPSAHVHRPTRDGTMSRGYLISIGRPAESFPTTISTSNLSLSTLILHPFLNYC
jgi:hypothetical protein